MRSERPSSLSRAFPWRTLLKGRVPGKDNWFFACLCASAPHPPCPLLPQGEKGESGRPEAQNESRNAGASKKTCLWKISPTPFSHKGRRGSLGVLQPRTRAGTPGLPKKPTPGRSSQLPSPTRGVWASCSPEREQERRGFPKNLPLEDPPNSLLPQGEKGESGRPEAQNESRNAGASKKTCLWKISPTPFSHKGRRGSLGVLKPETDSGRCGLRMVLTESACWAHSSDTSPIPNSAKRSARRSVNHTHSCIEAVRYGKTIRVDKAATSADSPLPPPINPRMRSGAVRLLPVRSTTATADRRTSAPLLRWLLAAGSRSQMRLEEPVILVLVVQAIPLR